MADTGDATASGSSARIERLAEQIAYHSDLYYNHAQTEISDAEFDELWEKLKRLSPNHPQLSRVGADIDPGSVKVEHLFPMRSLDKGTTDDDIRHFATQTASGAERFISQPKLDGSALSLEYKLGKLVRAATRGNGERGEDVTRNARRIPNIPLKLGIKVDAHVRGEVVMPLQVFNQKYRQISPNPRNLTSGALRQKDVEKGKADAIDLQFHAYDVRFPEPENRHPDSIDPPQSNDDSDLLSWLVERGVEVAQWKIHDSVESMYESTRDWAERRDSYGYEIDGVVFKVDNLAKRLALGMTAHHPRWALAWKFPPEVATSVLLAVDWQTGRTGNVTPVGRIAPQMVGGVTVENVTLHNPGELDRLSISIGDKVRIVRRGDVIPKIEASLGKAEPSDLENRFHADGTPFVFEFPTAEITIPNSCPSCSGEVEIEGAFLKCTDMMCSARTSRAIIYWCRALEMDGIGEKLIDQLLECGLVAHIPDLFNLRTSQLQSLERMGEKSARNVIDEIEKTKRMPLSRFIHALGLSGIGPELAESIAQYFKEIDALLKWEGDESLLEIEGVGQIVIEQLYTGLKQREKIINQLIQHIDIIESKVRNEGNFSGMTFCITGALESPRKEIQNLIKNSGGKVVSSVSAKLDVLVAGEKAGSKLNKARELGVTIWNEEELFSAFEVKNLKTLFDY